MQEEATPTPDSPQPTPTPSADPDGPFIEGDPVTLPCGFFRDGKVHTDARIAAMTGLTRKAIAKDDVRNNPIRVTDVILSHCLKSVGPYTAINKILPDLVIGDRDHLILEIRRISMGDEVSAGVECGECKAKVDLKFNLDELEMVKLDPEDYSVVDGEMTYRLNGKNFNALCRFPKGKDQGLVLQMANKNPVAASYGLYVACLLEWGDKKGPFETSFFEGLSVRVIDEFEDAFMSFQPGPIMKMDAPCPACSANIDFTFRGSDFLFRAPKRGRL